MIKVLQERGEEPTFPFSGIRAKLSTIDDVRHRVENAIAGIAKKDKVPFCIFVDGHLRGVIGLGGIDLVDRRATIESLLIDPDFQGQGIGPQAISILVRWAMTEVEFDTLLVDIAKENIPSRKAFRRCNFRYRGETEEFYVDVLGRKNTLIKYQVTNRNWNKRPSWYVIYLERLISKAVSRCM
jgi:RimJ/RimL family protein N-acetyltransferase